MARRMRWQSAVVALFASQREKTKLRESTRRHDTFRLTHTNAVDSKYSDTNTNLIWHNSEWQKRTECDKIEFDANDFVRNWPTRWADTNSRSKNYCFFLIFVVKFFRLNQNNFLFFVVLCCQHFAVNEWHQYYLAVCSVNRWFHYSVFEHTHTYTLASWSNVMLCMRYASLWMCEWLIYSRAYTEPKRNEARYFERKKRKRWLWFWDFETWIHRRQNGMKQFVFFIFSL